MPVKVSISLYRGFSRVGNVVKVAVYEHQQIHDAHTTGRSEHNGSDPTNIGAATVVPMAGIDDIAYAMDSQQSRTESYPNPPYSESPGANSRTATPQLTPQPLRERYPELPLNDFDKEIMRDFLHPVPNQQLLTLAAKDVYERRAVLDSGNEQLCERLRRILTNRTPLAQARRQLDQPEARHEMIALFYQSDASHIAMLGETARVEAQITAAVGAITSVNGPHSATTAWAQSVAQKNTVAVENARQKHVAKYGIQPFDFLVSNFELQEAKMRLNALKNHANAEGSQLLELASEIPSAPNGPSRRKKIRVRKKPKANQEAIA